MSNMSFTLQTRSAFNVQTIVDSVIYRIDKKRVDELYTAIPKVKTVFEDLNAILLRKLLKRNIDLIKYSPEQYYLQMIEGYGITLNYIPLGKSSVSCPLKPSDSAPLKHSTMPP